MPKAGPRSRYLARANQIACIVLAFSAGCGGKTDIGSISESAGPNPQSVIRDMCADLAAEKCVAALGGEKDCVSTVSEQRDVAFARGCAAPFDALLHCLSSQPVHCRGGSPDVEQCEQESQAVTRCANSGGGEECSVSGGGSRGPGGGESCMIDCPGYGVSCQGSNNNLFCQCAYGPRTGTTFNRMSCDDALSSGVCGGD